MSICYDLYLIILQWDLNINSEPVHDFLEVPESFHLEAWTKHLGKLGDLKKDL